MPLINETKFPDIRSLDLAKNTAQKMQPSRAVCFIGHYLLKQLTPRIFIDQNHHHKSHFKILTFSMQISPFKNYCCIFDPGST